MNGTFTVGHRSVARRRFIHLALALLLGLSATVAAHPFAPAHAAFPGANGKIVFGDLNGIATMNSDGSGRVDINVNGAFLEFPAWSADGSKIAFDDSTNIQVMNADGSGVRTIAALAGENDTNPVWSPDGTRIAFLKTSTTGQPPNIGVMNADGTNRSFAISTANFIVRSGPTWSPDGTRIAAALSMLDSGLPTTNPGIGTFSPRGGAVAMVTTSGNPYSDMEPDWSPDGGRIVFIRQTGPFPNGQRDVIRIGIDGRGAVNLTPNHAEPYFKARWSPDAKLIVADGQTSGDIFTMNAADGSALTNLTKSGGTDSPSWQPLAPFANTPLGNPSVTLNNPLSTGIGFVTLSFSGVTSAGTSSLVSDHTGPPAPTGYDLGTLPLYYHLSSTAVFISVTVCIRDQSISAASRLLHFTASGSTDVTGAGYPDVTAHMLCSATLTSLSPFAIATVSTKQLVSLAVTPAGASLAEGLNRQFTATGSYTDASTADLTATATWSSSDPGVATIGTTGLVHAVLAGSATITATSGTISGSTGLTVIPAQLASLAIQPANPSVVKGLTTQLTATGTYTDGSTTELTGLATWSSSLPGIATVDATGLAHGVSAGSTPVSAAFGAFSASTLLTVTPAALVSLAVTPAGSSLAKGLDRQFTVVGTYTDGSTSDLTSSATWSSSAPGIATIGVTGLAHAVAPGPTTIAAASGGKSGTTTLTVIPAQLVSLALTPAAPSIAKGQDRQFTATGTYTDGTTADLTAAAVWTSGTPAVATVSGTGLAHGVSTGSSTIGAASGSVSAGTVLTVTPAQLVSLSVTPAGSSLIKGLDRQLIATGTYTDGSTADLTGSSTWVSSAPAVATVGATGLAHAVATGNTIITATSGSTAGSTGLTVTPAELVSLAVTPAGSSLIAGLDRPFTATGTYTDGSTADLTATSSWSSSATGVATIAATGLAHAVAAGSTTIAAAVGTVTGSTGLTVTAASLDAPLTITWIGAASFDLGAVAAVAFRDADSKGQLAQYSALIDWGDQTDPSAGVVFRNWFGGGFAAAGWHQYAEPGDYQITVTVTDTGGATASRSTVLTVTAWVSWAADGGGHGLAG